MNERQEAEALADWLEGGAQPSSLDPLVVETVLALRSDLAPPHGVVIEDILDSLLAGPLVEPAVAEALSRWLEAGPGTSPPSILPVGIVESTYALRPEMAPAPSLTIDDILTGVSSGPLAQPVDVAPQVAEVIELSPPWWRQRVVGVVAVAAVALVVVIPGAQQVLNQPTPFDGSEAVADAPVLREVEFDIQSAPEVLEQVSAQPAKRSKEPAAIPPAESKPAPNSVPVAASGGARSARAESKGMDLPARSPGRSRVAVPAPSARSAPPMAAAPLSPAVAEEPAAAVASDAPEPEGISAAEMSDAASVEYSGMTDMEQEMAPPSVRSRRALRKESASAGRSEHRAMYASKGVDVAAEADSIPLDGDATAAQLAISKAKRARADGNRERALEIVTTALEFTSLSSPDRIALLELQIEVLIELGRDKEAQQAAAALIQLSEKR